VIGLSKLIEILSLPWLINEKVSTKRLVMRLIKWLKKPLKHYLNFLNKERRGYSLLYLLLETELSIPRDIKECIINLDKHYIPSRYPDVFDEGAPADYYTENDSKHCIECAKKILDWVKQFVEGSHREV
jgi:HEPN domain-containing protein